MVIAVKEHPIIFQGWGVKAILEGRKTQTRRTQGLENINENPDKWKLYPLQESEYRYCTFFDGHNYEETHEPLRFAKCPYGQVGDSLWIRETWAKIRRYKGGIFMDEEETIYSATEPEFEWVDGDGGWEFRRDGSLASHWKPSIHMPRWASRIDREITEIRGQRLQDITEADAIAEGCKSREEFRNKWNSINAKWKRLKVRGTDYYEFYQYPWSVEDAQPIPKNTKHPERYHCVPNPWVWAITFRMVK